MLDAPLQKLVMVAAPSHVSVLTLMQLPAFPFKQLVCVEVASSSSEGGGGVGVGGVPSSSAISVFVVRVLAVSYTHLRAHET